MKKFMLLMLTSILMVLAGPVWSDSAVHVLACQQDDEMPDEQVEAVSTAWLKAAKGVKGGENLELYLNFPIAAKAGDVDFLLILVAPSMGEWGTFMDNYHGSAAEELDGKHQADLDCGDGTLWESVKIK